jgi:hypothetical protein
LIRRSFCTEEGMVHLELRNPKMMEDTDLLDDMPVWARPLVHLVAPATTTSMRS